MRQQRVQRRPLKRAARRDLDQATPAPRLRRGTPAPRLRRDAGADTADALLSRIDQLLVSSASTATPTSGCMRP